MNAPSSIEPAAVYTAPEAARLISVHPKTMQQMLRDGIVKGSRKLRTWRVRGSELLKAAV